MTNLKSRLGLGLTLLVGTLGLAGCVTYAPTPANPTTTTESTTTTAPAVVPPAVIVQPNSTTTTTTQSAPTY